MSEYNFDDLNAVFHKWQEKKTYTCTIEETNDGSGDGILTFPDDFCESVGWKVGDTLDLCVSSDGNLIISKK